MTAHFYHLWADGDWRPAAIAHFGALRQHGLACPVYVGLAGSPEARREAASWLDTRVPSWILVNAADSGFEEVTLNALREWALHQDSVEPALYAHAKGSYTQYADNESWRQGMTSVVVGEWRDRVNDLLEFDASGPHWMGPPDSGHLTSWMFGGNFWWATAGYLRALPALPVLTRETRFEAEAWIGRGEPRVAPARPWWPRLALRDPYTGEWSAPKVYGLPGQR